MRRRLINLPPKGITCITEKTCWTYIPFVSRGVGFFEAKNVKMDGAQFYEKKLDIDKCNPDAYRSALPPRYGYTVDPSINGVRCRAIKPQMVKSAREYIRLKQKIIETVPEKNIVTYLPLGMKSAGPNSIVHLDQIDDPNAGIDFAANKLLPDPFRPGAYSYEWNVPYGARFSTKFSHQSVQLSALRSPTAACFDPVSIGKGWTKGGWLFFLMGDHARVITGLRMQGSPAAVKPNANIGHVMAGCMPDGTKESQAMLAGEISPSGLGQDGCFWSRDYEELVTEKGSSINCEVQERSAIPNSRIARFAHSKPKLGLGDTVEVSVGRDKGLKHLRKPRTLQTPYVWDTHC